MGLYIHLTQTLLSVLIIMPTRFTKKNKKRKPTKTKKKMRGGDSQGVKSKPPLPRGVSKTTITEQPNITELELTDMLEEKTNLNQSQKEDIIRRFKKLKPENRPYKPEHNKLTSEQLVEHNETQNNLNAQRLLLDEYKLEQAILKANLNAIKKETYDTEEYKKWLAAQNAELNKINAELNKINAELNKINDDRHAKGHNPPAKEPNLHLLNTNANQRVSRRITPIMSPPAPGKTLNFAKQPKLLKVVQMLNYGMTTIKGPAHDIDNDITSREEALNMYNTYLHGVNLKIKYPYTTPKNNKDNIKDLKNKLMDILIPPHSMFGPIPAGETLFYIFNQKFKNILSPNKKKDKYWKICKKDCMNLCKEYINKEIFSTAYMLRIITASIINDTELINPNLVTIEIHSVDCTKITGLWSNDSNFFTLKIDEAAASRLIMGFGPSASGKTHCAKKIIKLMSIAEGVSFPKVFITIDGGIFREQSQMYQTIIKIAKARNFRGIDNLVAAGFSFNDGIFIAGDIKKTFIVFLKNQKAANEKLLKAQEAQKEKHDILFKSQKEKHEKIFDDKRNKINKLNISLYVPETLGGCGFSGFKKTFVKDCENVYKEYLAITGDTKWIGAMMYQHKENCPFIEEYKCKGTIASGTDREETEGKKYSDTAWENSYDNGLIGISKAAYQFIIHNSGGKQYKNDSNMGDTITMLFDKNNSIIDYNDDKIKKFLEDNKWEYTNNKKTDVPLQPKDNKLEYTYNKQGLTTQPNMPDARMFKNPAHTKNIATMKNRWKKALKPNPDGSSKVSPPDSDILFGAPSPSPKIDPLGAVPSKPLKKSGEYGFIPSPPKIDPLGAVPIKPLKKSGEYGFIPSPPKIVMNGLEQNESNTDPELPENGNPKIIRKTTIFKKDRHTIEGGNNNKYNKTCKNKLRKSERKKKSKSKRHSH